MIRLIFILSYLLPFTCFGKPTDSAISRIVGTWVHTSNGEWGKTVFEYTFGRDGKVSVLVRFGSDSNKSISLTGTVKSRIGGGLILRYKTDKGNAERKLNYDRSKDTLEIVFRGETHRLLREKSKEKRVKRPAE